jgi:hypothetical protein
MHYSNLNMKIKLQTIRYDTKFRVNASIEQISKNNSKFKDETYRKYKQLDLQVGLKN